MVDGAGFEPAASALRTPPEPADSLNSYARFRFDREPFGSARIARLCPARFASA